MTASISPMPGDKISSFNRWLLFFILAFGSVYIGKAWTPSSYALALNIFQVSDDGIITGKPRGIRSDEWAVLTPLTQATVNNHFQRYNQTSFYNEDLRMMFSLPVFDWGMIFKPTMWPYAFVKPAYAFSFHHYAIIVLFVVGYMQLFRLAGGSRPDSLLLSFILFFSSFTQFWWTSLGPVLAFFPWLILASSWKSRYWIKLLGFYWIATCWLLSFFYPPIIISLSFVGLIFLLAFNPQLFRLKSVLGHLFAGILAVITAIGYLQDYLLATWNTLYPGRRNFGGGAVPFDEWLSQFFPTANLHHLQGSLIGQNICEIGTVGTYYTLLVLCFLRYQGAKGLGSDSLQLKQLALITAGLVMTTAWMLLPLPPWMGAPLLWNQVHPERMEYAAGLILLLLPFFLATRLGLSITWPRFTLFAAIIFGGWYYSKLLRGFPNILDTWYDWVVVPVALVVIFFLRRVSSVSANTLFLAVSAIFSAAAFGHFNPVQSAHPIFEREHTAVTEMLDNLASGNKEIALAGFPGATLNGWGYRSVSHVNTTPKLDIWRAVFPEMSQAEMDQIFNRYAHIIITSDKSPRLIQADAVAVPSSTFPKNAIPSSAPDYSGRTVETEYSLALPSKENGHIDTITVEPHDSKINITGWVPWRAGSEQQTLYILTEPPAVNPKLTTIVRPDVARHLNSKDYGASGFSLEFSLASHSILSNAGVCMVAISSNGESVILHNPHNPDSCATLTARNRH